MPHKLGGKKLTAKQHRQWKHVYQSARTHGASDDSAGAQATAAVKKGRSGGKGARRKKH